MMWGVREECGAAMGSPAQCAPGGGRGLWVHEGNEVTGTWLQHGGRFERMVEADNLSGLTAL